MIKGKSVRHQIGCYRCPCPSIDPGYFRLNPLAQCPYSHRRNCPLCCRFALCMLIAHIAIGSLSVPACQSEFAEHLALWRCLLHSARDLLPADLFPSFDRVVRHLCYLHNCCHPRNRFLFYNILGYYHIGL